MSRGHKAVGQGKESPCEVGNEGMKEMKQACYLLVVLLSEPLKYFKKYRGARIHNHSLNRDLGECMEKNEDVSGLC